MMLKYLKCLLPYMTVSNLDPLINHKNYRIKNPHVNTSKNAFCTWYTLQFLKLCDYHIK